MMMKSIGKVLFVVSLLCVWVGSASAAQYVFEPSKWETIELSHWNYYTWGIDFSVPENETIVGASITFNDIGNWMSPRNDLWLHLLDDATDGIERHRDLSFLAVDSLADQGELLKHWDNLPAWARDRTYTFDTSDLDVLVSYLLNDSIGIGFDPDCHYHHSGVTFMLETTPVPVPASLGLLGLGLVGLVGLSRRRRKK